MRLEANALAPLAKRCPAYTPAGPPLAQLFTLTGRIALYRSRTKSEVCRLLSRIRQKQGASGLGLEVQKTAVLDYLNGGRWKFVCEFTEVESGKRSEAKQGRRNGPCELGAADCQLIATFGWSTSKQATVYVNADRKRFAASA